MSSRPKQKAKLSEETIIEYNEKFKQYDIKETGKIPVLQVSELMRKVGLMPSELEIEVDCIIVLNLKTLKEMIREVDEEKNALVEGINFKQFCEIASRKYNEVYTESDIKQAFRTFDVDNNGFLAATEVEHALSTMGEKLTNEEMKALLTAAKVDSDGNIHYEEFVHNIMEWFQ